MKTIEEKARAYDEALEKAKEILEMASDKSAIYTIFPELAESLDEKIRKGIFKALSKKDARDVLISQGIEVSDALAWLKSLRPQNRWKPSDEQMMALLYHCSNGSVLTSLYNDLNKLKEGNDRT